MAEFTNDKMLPQSLEAEQAVLAAMFNDRDAILEVIPVSYTHLTLPTIYSV